MYLQSDEIDRDKKYEELGILGRGGYAQVLKIRKKETGQLFALKRIKRYRLNDEKVRRQIMLEIQLMQEMDHENIIKLNDYFYDEEHLNLVLELADRGSLYENLQQYGNLPEDKVILYIRDVVAALEYLHNRQQPIIHRDIKPQNILIDANGRCKISDFGSSNTIDLKGGTRDTYAGTQIYMAPQMITNIPYNESIDLWNVGVMIYQLLTGENPFIGEIKDALQDLITKKDIEFPANFPTLARDVVKRLLQKQPSHRMTLKQLKNHLWLNSTIETPMMKTFYVREEENVKLAQAKVALRELKEKQEIRKQQQDEIAALRLELKNLKKERYLAKKKSQFRPGEYFELSETLKKLKGEFAANSVRLQQRHAKLLKKAQAIKLEEEQIQQQIAKHQADIEQLMKKEPKMIVKIRQSFTEAKKRLAEFTSYLQGAPQKLYNDLTYFRDSKIKMPPPKVSLQIIKLTNQTLLMHKRALQEQKLCLVTEINNRMVEQI